MKMMDLLRIFFTKLDMAPYEHEMSIEITSQSL